MRVGLLVADMRVRLLVADIRVGLCIHTHSNFHSSKGPGPLFATQKVTEIYNKVTEMYKKVTELKISSWNVLSLLRSEIAYIGTEAILP